MSVRYGLAVFAFTALSLFVSQHALAQGFGPSLRNSLMPASGGMGGVSLARPQDVQSSLSGNPATLAQRRGTQFSMSGAWVEPTFNVGHLGGNLPNVGDFTAKSNAQGSALGNIAVTQDLRALGLPMTWGMGLLGTSGAGLNSNQVPESNGAAALIQVLEIGMGAGVDVSERLSVGATIILGASVFNGPFTGISTAVADYALGGELGLTYDLGNCTTLGFGYTLRKSYRFDDAIRFELPLGGFGIVQDIHMDLPATYGLGIATERLMDGRLLLGMDVLYFDWDNTNLFGPFYENQWAFQFGAQYKLNSRVRLRMGYVYAENVTQANPGDSAGGVTPPRLEEAIQYAQAQLPNINQHRISAGIGIRDMLPGVDVNLFAGGMPRASQNYGDFTSANLESYWVGFGTTWRFGRGSCHRLPVPDQW